MVQYWKKVRYYDLLWYCIWSMNFASFLATVKEWLFIVAFQWYYIENREKKNMYEYETIMFFNLVSLHTVLEKR